MASVGHIAVGLAAGRALSNYARSRGGEVSLVRAMTALAGISMLPDLDALGFAFGIPYASPFGHRGATHSLAFALCVAVLAWAVTRSRSWMGAAFAVAASHGLLDALTDGGLGVALAWPVSSERYFFPWRPLWVSPIGMRIFSPRGVAVLTKETLLFAPLWLYALWPVKTARDGS